MSTEEPRRIVRIACAWLVSILCGFLGMGLWAVTLQRIDLGSISYGLGALVFAGLGVFAGAYIARWFLNSTEKTSFFRAPPDEF